jgi:hypothetical protein
VARIAVSGRFLLPLAWALILAGCEAARYDKPIATFADAAANAEAALVSLDKTTTDQYAAFLSERARKDLRFAVLAARRECGLDAQRCRIVLANPAPGADAPEQFPPAPLLGNMVRVMGEIRAYAQNLAALVADDSAAKAEADVNAALASVQRLADTVAEAQGKAKGTVPSFATPVGAGVNWVVGQYANHVKLAGLKRATEEADPVIRSAASLFETAAKVGTDVLRPDLARSFQAKLDAYQQDRGDPAKLSAAVDAARTYDELLQAQPGETFRKMGEAHAALTAALHGADVSWPQAIAEVQSFAAQAERLAKIAKGLAVLAQKEGTK